MAMTEHQEVDLFRETVLRYTAFASDFGEALRPFISKRVYLGSYGVVAAYAAADTLDRGIKAYFRTRQPLPLLPARRSALSRGKQHKLEAKPMPWGTPAPAATRQHVLATVADSMLWHAAASLVLPGILINRTVWATSKLLARHPGLSPALSHTLPTLAGLATIPLIVPHIDLAVSHWMDTHVRPRLPLEWPGSVPSLLQAPQG